MGLRFPLIQRRARQLVFRIYHVTRMHIALPSELSKRVHVMPTSYVFIIVILLCRISAGIAQQAGQRKCDSIRNTIVIRITLMDQTALSNLQRKITGPRVGPNDASVVFAKRPPTVTKQ